MQKKMRISEEKKKASKTIFLENTWFFMMKISFWLRKKIIIRKVKRDESSRNSIKTQILLEIWFNKDFLISRLFIDLIIIFFFRTKDKTRKLRKISFSLNYKNNLQRCWLLERKKKGADSVIKDLDKKKIVILLDNRNILEA